MSRNRNPQGSGTVRRIELDPRTRLRLSLLDAVPDMVMADDMAWAELESLIACGAGIEVAPHARGSNQYGLLMLPYESYMSPSLSFDDWMVIYQQQATEQELRRLLILARHIHGEVLQLRATLARKALQTNQARLPLIQSNSEASQIFSRDQVPLEVLLYQQDETDHRLSLLRWKLFRDYGGQPGLGMFAYFQRATIL